MSEQGPGQKRRLPPIVIVGIVLAIFCGISLYIRVALPYDQVFVNDGVWFRESDAYYHIRNIENLVNNFPHFNSFDPYMCYPGGGPGLIRPFFDWLVAAVVLLVSRGGVSAQHLIEVVGAYMPAILGTLTIIPVYFIGKVLFNRWVGLISAALLAILPGEFMHRSLLGFTDHHAAETLFSTVSMLFLIIAIKRAREKEISFRHILTRDWSTITKPLVYTLVAGICLGIYLLSWQGGLLFVFIIFVCLVIQFIVDHLKHRSSDYLCIVGTPLFLIAFLMVLPVLGKAGLDSIYRVAMLIAIVVPVVLSIISRLMIGRALKPVYYPLTLVGLAVIGLAALRVVNPSLLQYMFAKFSIFAPGGAQLTITEMQPLLWPSGSFTLQTAWLAFTTSFFIAFISLAMLIYIAVKEKNDDKTLFLVWSIIMLIATLSQGRFSYYYAVSAALLTGYFSWKMLDVAGLSKLLTKSGEVVTLVKRSKRKKRRIRETTRPRTFMQPRGVWVKTIVVGIAIFFVVFFPNIPVAKALASQPNVFIDEGWYTSLLWLKDNSPEPFADPDFYYELYPPKADFKYPQTAYGVMSWWDYGYLIMQIAHRMPNANPGGQSMFAQAGQFFTAQNESSADKLADNRGTKYVMMDYAMATPSKFYAMAEWAGKSVDEFYEVYYMPTQEGGQWGHVFYPAYYNSIAVRLYNFDGQAVAPTESTVITYEDKVNDDGQKYKELTWGQSFSSYEDAQAYVASQESGNHIIVGTNPFSSPVPLEELNDYELVYQSQATTTMAAQTAPSVKIFEYLDSGQS